MLQGGCSKRGTHAQVCIWNGSKTGTHAECRSVTALKEPLLHMVSGQSVRRWGGIIKLILVLHHTKQVVEAEVPYRTL